MVLMKNPSTVFPEEKNKSSANTDKDSKNSVGVKTDKPNRWKAMIAMRSSFFSVGASYHD